MTTMSDLERVQAERRARDEAERAAYVARRTAEVAAIRQATGLPVGTGWRSWDDPTGTPNDPEAREKLPKVARELADTAEAAGWRWVCSWSLSSSDAPFVDLVVTGSGWKVWGTWHTEGSPSGKPRLFHLMAKGPARGWHDLSVKAARELVTANPCEPQADSAAQR